MRENFCEKKFINIFFITQNIYRQFLLYSILIIFITLSLVDTTKLIKQKKKNIINNTINNLIIIIDISNSMNANDIIPSRLEKAKKIAENIIYKIPINKIALIVFAGQSYTLIPMTNDINALILSLNNIKSNIIDFQGTNISNALKESIQLFNQNHTLKKNIILISDGEDNFNNENLIIKLAKKNHIKIISIGVGTYEGSKIPLTYQNNQIKYLTDQKKNIVITKLKEKKLQNISKNTFGIYINSSIMSNKKITQFIYNFLILNKQNDTIKNFKQQIKHHYFQWYILFALFIFFIICLTNLHNEFNI